MKSKDTPYGVSFDFIYFIYETQVKFPTIYLRIRRLLQAKLAVSSLRKNIRASLLVKNVYSEAAARMGVKDVG